MRLLPSGKIYLDGNPVTVTRRIIDGTAEEVAAPRVGYQHISSDASLWPNATYPTYQYTEDVDIGLDKKIDRITLKAFATLVSIAYPPLGFAAKAVYYTALALSIYHNYMQENSPAAETVYIRKAVYTTATLVNPPNQYFQYVSSYYHTSNNGNYTGYVVSDTTYGALMQGL